MLKISAGEYRSRRLLAPPDAAVSRPYAHRVKEAVFNLLRGWFEDARVLDLFAGVGTVGLEAVSRGAQTVVMVEHDRRIFRLLERNIDALDCRDRAVAVNADALSPAALVRAPRPSDLVFVDPPYALLLDEPSRARVLGQMARCADLMVEGGFAILRSPIGVDEASFAVDGLDGPETRGYGAGTWVLLYQRAGGEDGRDG